MNEALVRSAQNGDQRAFAKLVDEYYRPIYGLAFSAVGNWQAAEDVAQDAFLVAWLNIGKLRTIEAFGAWMRRIARNLACNWIRSDRYRRGLLERRETLAPEAKQSPCVAADNLARTDARAEIWEALATLSPALREAVVLFYLEENSIAQTATVLGITENSVKKRLQHARPQLRKHFEEQWKAELEGERRRIHSSEAGQRFMAGVALGPVSGLAGKLGTGAGLWLHGALRGEGAGRLAGLLSFDSAVLRPAMIALAVVVASGAGLLWNTHRQEPASESAALSKPALTAAPGGAAKAASAVKPEERNPLAGNPVLEPEAAVAKPTKKETPARVVTVSGYVFDGEQHPIQGATVTVVACGLAEPAVKSTSGFGAADGGAGGDGFGASGGVSGGVSGASPRAEDWAGMNISSRVVGVPGGNAGSPTVVSKGGGATLVAGARQVPEDVLDEALLDDARRFSVKTASDGSYSIADVPFEGQLVVSADAPGFRLQGTTLATIAGMPKTDLSFTLSPGVSVEGRVFGAEGRPVTDALLQVTALAWIREGGSGGWGVSPEDWGWARTDAQGRFTLKVEEQGYATISVRSQTLGKAAFANVRVEPGVAADLRFTKPSAIRGKITRPDGRPASGITVQLSGQAMLDIETEEPGCRHRTRVGTSAPPSSATTDAEGGYQFEGLDSKMRYTASLLDEVQTPIATGIELEPLVAGQTLLWNYTLLRPIVVKGVVTEHASGRPAAGAVIVCGATSEAPEIGTAMGMPAARATTGSDGTFEMRITTTPGEYVFGIQTLTGFRLLSQREVREGESVVLNLTLPGSWSRSFLVVDASGNPLSGANVMIQTEGGDAYHGYSQKTGDDGRVRVTDLAPDKGVKCRFQYEGHEAESEILEGQEGMEFPEETVVIEEISL